MPTPLTHGMIGLALAQASPDDRPRWRYAAALVFLSAAPDLDLILYHLGIYDPSPWSHRGLSHSLVVGVISAALVVTLVLRPKNKPRRRWALVWVLALVSATSHGLLDAITNGGPGVGLLLPFSDGRFFFSVRPILVIPPGAESLLHRAVSVLASEFLWVWLPVIFVSAACRARHLKSWTGRIKVPARASEP